MQGSHQRGQDLFVLGPPQCLNHSLADFPVWIVGDCKEMTHRLGRVFRDQSFDRVFARLRLSGLELLQRPPLHDRSDWLLAQISAANVVPTGLGADIATD